MGNIYVKSWTVWKLDHPILAQYMSCVFSLVVFQKGNRPKQFFEKKFSEIKSYQFETLFSRTFFLVPVWFHRKKSPEKCPLVVKNAWEQRMFTAMEKRRLILRTPLAIFNMQMDWGKRLRLDLIFPRHRTFFFRILISEILLPKTLLTAPILFYYK